MLVEGGVWSRTAMVSALPEEAFNLHQLHQD